MKRQERLILKAYCREHIKSVAVFGAITAVFLAIAGIYDYGEVIRNMSYAAVLVAFFGVLFGIWDYIRYRKKCIALILAVDRTEERDSVLPESRSYVESLYQEMVCAAEKEKYGLISEYDAKKQDMADYYTMWTHQIKTPIAAMRLLIQGEKQALEELFKIEQYAEMALHYARLDSLSSDLLLQERDIYEMIKQAVKKYSILFIGSGLGFTFEEFSARAVTDEKWVTFVIEQILSNALKYTTHGEIRIYGLDRQGRKTNAQAAFIVIEDNGIGIRKEDLPRIFERGFTGYNGRLDKKSTGIGLYLCKQILDRLSHTIQVESEVGKGTKVILGFVQDAM